MLLLIGTTCDSRVANPCADPACPPKIGGNMATMSLNRFSVLIVL
jgi:hypothetical protein